MGIKLRPDEADILKETALSWGYRDAHILGPWVRFSLQTSEMRTQGQSIIVYNNARGNYVKLTGEGHEKLYDDFRESLG